VAAAALSACSLSSSSSGGGGGGGGGSGPHSVNLSWNASSSNNIVGYNVYRGTLPESYALLTSMNATTSYTDSAVQNGQTYYYVVTAVDSAGVESAYSNQTQALIP
jgi:fibronectin type 3 domain-containing protein